MEAGERLQIGERFCPGDLVAEFRQGFLLSRLQNRKGLDDAITERRWKFTHRRQDIVRELPMMRALFDNREIIRTPHDFPHLRELRREHSPEKRSDTDIGEIIAAPPDLALARAVVAELRMIQRLLHEPGKSHRSILPNSFADELDQIRIAGVHRIVKKVKSGTWLKRPELRHR